MGEIDTSFVEALPCFNILTLGKAYRRGARLLFWYDQDGRLVGGASIELTNGLLDLSYSFKDAGEHVMDGSWISTLDVITREDGQRGERRGVICPKCNRRKDVLLFLGIDWQCSVCHGVKNLSNSLDTATLQYIKLDELGKSVQQGRVLGEHHATFAARRAEYERRKALWGDQPPRTLTAHQRMRINERYFTKENAPLPTEREPSLPRGQRSRRR